MMESLPMGQIIELVKGFGLPGLILVIWWLSQKEQNRALTAYREDTQITLNNYKEDMAAQRAMYDNNIVLVKNYNSLCSDLKEIVMPNAGQFQLLNKNIEDNNFCPFNRVKKVAGVPE